VVARVVFHSEVEKRDSSLVKGAVIRRERPIFARRKVGAIVPHPEPKPRLGGDLLHPGCEKGGVVRSCHVEFASLTPTHHVQVHQEEDLFQGDGGIGDKGASPLKSHLLRVESDEEEGMSGGIPREPLCERQEACGAGRVVVRARKEGSVFHAQMVVMSRNDQVTVWMNGAGDVGEDIHAFLLSRILPPHKRERMEAHLPEPRAASGLQR